MSSGLTADTAPADGLARSLTAAADQLADPADLLATIGQRVLADATGRAPRASGALAGSGFATPGTVEGNPAAVLAWGVRYALFVNFGTATMRARPFATDALTAAAGDADPLLAQWAETIIGKVGT